VSWWLQLSYIFLRVFASLWLKKAVSFI